MHKTITHSTFPLHISLCGWLQGACAFRLFARYDFWQIYSSIFYSNLYGRRSRCIASVWWHEMNAQRKTTALGPETFLSTRRARSVRISSSAFANTLGCVEIGECVCVLLLHCAREDTIEFSFDSAQRSLQEFEPRCVCLLPQQNETTTIVVHTTTAVRFECETIRFGTLSHHFVESRIREREKKSKKNPERRICMFMHREMSLDFRNIMPFSIAPTAPAEQQ